ncbi:MAG: 30S ribosomal protein S4 [Candidatus Moranbacteria bacterium CG_4_9_14_3_um_filter_45_14]|nr:MAG: 30S ribosomal protein S4 [Candidatus Moranbacteria bacterium CG2_30_45_14]PJA84987.1 MAG: 30S ribosomal protein S4 [Candidatus Moranbacteria bacterium CG_4_9_14_3_um_filter_45_14]
MPNNIDSKCKLCRRAGEKLFLKGDRCLSPKCAMVRRPYAPGIHGHTPSRGGSEFGRQLAMKQKIKRLYGVMERQFRHHFDEVRKIPGITGDQLLSRLERRLDNVIYRLGFATSRAQAKQLVSHNMFSVNGVRVNIPSYEIRVNDVVSLKQSKKEKQFFKNQEELLKNKKDVPHWLSLDAEKQIGKVLAIPGREDVGVRVDAQMVVEYYSK